MTDFARLPLTSILPRPGRLTDPSTKEWAGKLNTFLDDYLRRVARKVNQIAYEIELGAVMNADYNANTILYATTDDTPVTLTIGASTIVGRKATGNICAMTITEVLALAVGEAVIFGGITGTSLTLDLTQDYKFTQRVSAPTLAIQSQTTATGLLLELFTKDGDGTDGMGFYLYGKGLPSSITNREYVALGYNEPTNYFLTSNAGGTGTVLPLSIYVGANTTQLVLNTDGSISVSGVFDASAGEVLVEDNATAAPSGKSDGYVGVAYVAGHARLYFNVEGVMYHINAEEAAASPVVGNPLGLLLPLTYAA